MNDLDLRAALHRDADLVGEPSPDLLDQLFRRRRHQRRQRGGVMAAALGVVLIGACIPVGQALLTQSDGRPAVETTVAPPPPVTPENTPVVPPPSPAPSPSPSPETDVVEPPPVPDAVAPGCPDQATLLAIRSASAPDTSADLFTSSMATVCSGQWAFTVFIHEGVDDEGFAFGNSMPQLFRFVGGAWTPVHRSEHCAAGEIADDVWELVCNAG